MTAGYQTIIKGRSKLMPLLLIIIMLVVSTDNLILDGGAALLLLLEFDGHVGVLFLTGRLEVAPRLCEMIVDVKVGTDIHGGGVILDVWGAGRGRAVEGVVWRETGFDALGFLFAEARVSIRIEQMKEMKRTYRS